MNISAINDTQPDHPRIKPAGVDGMIVQFASELREPANRAALAFRAAVETQGWEGVEETASSLSSVYLRFDPLHLRHKALHTRLRALLDRCDWYQAPLPAGRRLWQVPAVFGGDLAPDLDHAMGVAGLNRAEAIRTLTRTALRVQTIGFAPGQPYLGQLPEQWNIARKATLTPQVPEGAIALAVRQLVLFSVPMPTGWYHVGQMALRVFQPEAADPFLLRPGDEVQFSQVGPEMLANMHDDPFGGARSRVIG